MNEPKRCAWLRAALVSALCVVPPCALAQQERPQYGGTLNIATVWTAANVSSWDPADWAVRHNHDTGLVYEFLFAGDLSKAVRNGGKHRFIASAWLPADAIRGELAESWSWKDNPLRVEIKLRKGVMFPDKPGVMAARELVADDVVFSFNRLAGSPKKIPTYYDYIDKVYASDRYTVVMAFKEYNVEWDYRFGWGYFNAIVPKEVTDAGGGNWKNVNGTGPFALTDYVAGSSATFDRNPTYWDKESIGGRAYKLPYADRIVYRTIKDEAAQLTALRTGKLDVLESVRWNAVDELKKSAPALKWSRWLSTAGNFIALRVDTKPFDDVRVRRALNMAVNKQEILQSFYGGDAELLSYPQHIETAGYYEPLDAMPPAVKELFVYDPAKAKKLLAEAGFPSGFSFKVQVCSCAAINMDLLPLVAAYLEKVGVKIQIEPMEFGAFFSVMTNKTNAPGYMTGLPAGNPYGSIRRNFVTNQTYNPNHYSDPVFDRHVDEFMRERDEGKRQAMVKALTREILEKAPSIWLPVPYYYTAWWPWVKNYGGELRVGADRPGPIHARIWIDQELKRNMGY